MHNPTGPVPIPQPSEYASVAEMATAYRDHPAQGFADLARRYGPIYQLRQTNAAGRVLVVSGFRLVDEVCDDALYDKNVGLPLRIARVLMGDGLFTARTDEPAWARAHSVLMPTFSPQAVREYLSAMWDVAEQMLLKWERLNPGEEIDVRADMTRLTLDVIGLCGFHYRFNSFYREQPHPFIATLARAIQRFQRLLRDPAAASRSQAELEALFEEDVAFMNGLIDEVVRARRALGPAGAGIKDLLNAALNGVDKRTGERLDDANVRNQIITFLFAGHETTSSLLSLALATLLKRPRTIARMVDEVDAVLGPDLSAPPNAAQLQQLVFVEQVLKEVLRLLPPVQAFQRRARAPRLLGGQYAITPEDEIVVNVASLHRDPEIWGPRPESFDPDRFAPDAERARPANAFKPFGTGQRACIGRQFAMQEATLVLAKVLQRFELDDFADYQLRLVQQATIKPDGFRLRVRRRTPAGRPRVDSPAPEPPPTPSARVPPLPMHQTPLLVLFGSNLGTAENLARQLAEDAVLRGFSVTTAPLDAWTGRLPSRGAVVAVASSYNGAPADNAARFCEWLTGSGRDPRLLDGVRFAVFGCGHQDWASTFQKVPAQLDEGLAARGAQRVLARGVGDAKVDLDGQFRAWESQLWPALANALDLQPPAEPLATPASRFAVEVLAEPVPNPFVVSLGAHPMRVLVNRELQSHDGPRPSERSTRHLELAVPEGISYEAGDHLGIIPHNALDAVGGVLRRFGLGSDARLCIRLTRAASAGTHLPLEHPIAAALLLAQYVELHEVASRAQIRTLAEHAGCPPEKAALVALSGEGPEGEAAYRERVLAARATVFDLLERFASCAPPFAVLLEMLPPLRPRFYSISSSPRVDPRRLSLTVGVLDAASRSSGGRFQGTCSTYLARRPEGSFVYAFVRKPAVSFRPPEDPRTPMILVGPGTGVAPFRGFLQERAVRKRRGEPVARSLLFFGCRDPEQDFLYADELRALEAEGVVELACAFSRLPSRPKAYVQDVIRERADAVWSLLSREGIIYVCGDAANMAPGVRGTFAQLFSAKTGGSAQQAEQWLGELTAQGRYRVDVWGQG